MRGVENTRLATVTSHKPFQFIVGWGTHNHRYSRPAGYWFPTASHCSPQKMLLVSNHDQLQLQRHDDRAVRTEFWGLISINYIGIAKLFLKNYTKQLQLWTQHLFAILKSKEEAENSGNTSTFIKFKTSEHAQNTYEHFCHLIMQKISQCRHEIHGRSHLPTSLYS